MEILSSNQYAPTRIPHLFEVSISSPAPSIQRFAVCDPKKSGFMNFLVPSHHSLRLTSLHWAQAEGYQANCSCSFWLHPHPCRSLFCSTQWGLSTVVWWCGFNGAGGGFGFEVWYTCTCVLGMVISLLMLAESLNVMSYWAEVFHVGCRFWFPILDIVLLMLYHIKHSHMVHLRRCGN